MEDFYKLVKKLRKECPWDAEQTQKSLIPFLLEEAYELIDAIDKDDKKKIREELGDLLLNIFMQMVILEESDESQEEIIDIISKKIIRRHPHVFNKGSDPVTKAEVLKKWQQIKKDEKPTSILSDVPLTLPSLLLSQRLQKIASSVGFDWDDINGVYDKLKEEIEELKDADSDKEKEEELGDILFVLAHLGNFLKIDTELALRKTCEKFKKRFKAIEEGLKKKGKTFKQSNLDEMETLWQQAKED